MDMGGGGEVVENEYLRCVLRQFTIHSELWAINKKDTI